MRQDQIANEKRIASLSNASGTRNQLSPCVLVQNQESLNHYHYHNYLTFILFYQVTAVYLPMQIHGGCQEDLYTVRTGSHGATWKDRSWCALENGAECEIRACRWCISQEEASQYPEGNKLEIAVPHIIHDIDPSHVAKDKQTEAVLVITASKRLWRTWPHTSNVLQMDVPQLNTNQSSFSAKH